MIPVWLITALGSARKAAVALFGVVARYPWQSACVALLVACVWLHHGRAVALSDLAQCKAARAADHAAYVKAQKEAQAKAIAAKAAAEADYRQKAERADNAYQTELANARSAADRYIATHRLRPASPTGGPVAAPSGGGPGVHQDVPADPVVVGADDVQACSSWVAYGLKAREWALSLAP